MRLEKILLVVVTLLLNPLGGTCQLNIQTIYNITRDTNSNGPSFIYGNNIDDSENIYEGHKLISGEVRLGSDTVFNSINSENKSILYKITPQGQLAWTRFCQNPPNSTILNASVNGNKIYLVYSSENQSNIGLFDGSNLGSVHKKSIFLSVIESNGNHLYTKEIWNTDSANSYSYYFPQITANNSGEIFISGNFIGHWNFQGLHKYWPPKKNNYNQDIWQFFIAKLNSNGDLVWIHDSVYRSTPGRSVMFYSEKNKQLVVSDRFSDTLRFGNGKTYIAKNPIILTSADNFTLAIDDSGRFVWSTHFNSSGATIASTNPNEDSTYNITIATAGFPLKVNGDTVPFQGYVHIVNLDKAGNKQYVHGASSKDYNYMVSEKNGTNGTKFLQYYCNTKSYALGDSSTMSKTGEYNTCIWYIKNNVVLNKLNFSSSQGVFADLQFQNSANSFMVVYFQDSFEINGNKVFGTLNKRTMSLVKISNSLMNGIQKTEFVSNGLTTQLNLYPNPAHSRMTASWQPSNSAPTQINIADGMGNVLKTYSAPAFVNTINMDVAGLKPGLYFVLFDNKYWKEGRTLLIKE